MRHALITAGTKGLGVQVAEALLSNNYSVTVTYRSDHQAVNELKIRWKQYADRLQFVQADITKKEDIYHTVDIAFQKFKRIDLLINNAGPYIFERKKLVDYEDDEWDYLIEGNLSANFHLIKK